jgi:AbrB family looped-hinge helix DNA binding protein
MTTKIDDRGRVLIPKELRERLGLEPGTEVLIDADDEGVHLRPAMPRSEALSLLLGGITEENAVTEEPIEGPLDVKEIWEPDP